MERKEAMLDLELKSLKVLSRLETMWRVTSRSLWIKDGDQNMKYFQRFGSHRKSINFVSKLRSNDGIPLLDQRDLKREAVAHF